MHVNMFDGRKMKSTHVRCPLTVITRTINCCGLHSQGLHEHEREHVQI
jgi:hypothetical protein